MKTLKFRDNSDKTRLLSSDSEKKPDLRLMLDFQPVLFRWWHLRGQKKKVQSIPLAPPSCPNMVIKYRTHKPTSDVIITKLTFLHEGFKKNLMNKSIPNSKDEKQFRIKTHLPAQYRSLADDASVRFRQPEMFKATPEKFVYLKVTSSSELVGSGCTVDTPAGWSLRNPYC